MKEERARMVRGQAFVERQLQVLRLGDIVLVAMQARAVRRDRRPHRRRQPVPPGTLVSGYSNGTFGYMPTRAAFAEGGYEVDTALYGPATEDLVVEAGPGPAEESSTRPGASAAPARCKRIAESGGKR
jgi:hypothetical protein